MSGETVRQLAERIRQLETSFRLCEPVRIPLGTCGLDALFPDEGLSAGSLVELFPRVAGAGAWTLALVLARYACGERKTLLIADQARCFYPPAARKFGLDPRRTVIVRPRTVADSLLAIAQALRCSAIGTAIGEFERLADRDSRRLQLAAEAGGTVGVLVRPLSAVNTPSFASVRLLMDPLPSWRGRRRMKLEVLRSRAVGGREAGENKENLQLTIDNYQLPIEEKSAPLPIGNCQLSIVNCQFPSSPFTREGKCVYVEIDDVTGHVRVFSALELAASLAPSA